MLLSPAGARVVTAKEVAKSAEMLLLSPAGARVVTGVDLDEAIVAMELLSPAGARVVTAESVIV